MNIPTVDLKKEHSFCKKQINRQIKECLAKQQWILGPKVYEFEKKVADYLGSKYTIGVSSGTDALVLSLRALAIKYRNKEYFDKKDEIITTPFTFAATAESIIRSGATPVFADIDPDTFNICPQSIKKAITKNTVGVIPVHLFGLSCDMGSICSIAKNNGLFILEDAAQSFGGRYEDKKLGTLGNAGAFSFFPSKNLGSFGDAGLIATDNKKLADLIKVLRNHGQTKQYNADYIGYNSRLDSIQAAVLLAKIKHIDKLNNLRRKIAKNYNMLLSDIKELKTPLEPDYACHVYNLYTLRVSSERNKLANYLNSKGIGARIYYPKSLDKMKAFKTAKIGSGLKEVKQAIDQVLSLPCHPFLSIKEKAYIIKAINGFFNR